MKWLARLLGVLEQTPDYQWLVGSGDYEQEIVGESYYQRNLDHICGPKTGKRVRQEVDAYLVCENHNPHDSNAVAVLIDGLKVGHLSRGDAVEYRQYIRQLGFGEQRTKCRALIRGGQNVAGGAKAHYGVWLDINIPED